MDSKAKVGLFAVLGLALLVSAFFLFWGRGSYGTVSRETYDIVTALHSASLAKSEARIGKVEEYLTSIDPDEEKISAAERGWIQKIIKKARSGNWKAAARISRDILEDQVEY